MFLLLIKEINDIKENNNEKDIKINELRNKHLENEEEIKNLKDKIVKLEDEINKHKENEDKIIKDIYNLKYKDFKENPSKLKFKKELVNNRNNSGHLSNYILYLLD
jgi:chromosome segregation ATPase